MESRHLGGSLGQRASCPLRLRRDRHRLPIGASRAGNRRSIPARVVCRNHLAAMENREYAVGVVHGFVNDPIRIADYLADAFVICRRVGITCERNDGTHFREIAKRDDGIAYLGSPALRIVSGEFTRDCPDDSTKLVRRSFRPSVGHGRTLSLISLSSESNSSSSSTVSLFTNSCRDFSITWFRYERFRMASISSQVLSKSATLIITLVERPFCVMTIGRCVRAVRAKQSLSVRRYSVNGTTSSSSRGRSIVFGMVFISSSPARNDGIVPHSVPCGKGCDAFFWSHMRMRNLGGSLGQRASCPLRQRPDRHRLHLGHLFHAETLQADQNDPHIPCLSRNCRMAVSWSTPRPSAISLRDLRTVSASRNTSISGSKSAALTRTASARPLRVTMRGRCVSFTRAKQAARLLRHSENGTMSSVRRGRRRDAVLVKVGMRNPFLGSTASIVQKSVRYVKGMGKQKLRKWFPC